MIPLLLLALAAPSSDAALTGRVTIAGTGEPVTGALVRIVELDRRTVTDADGRFTLHDVPGGRWTLEVQHGRRLGTSLTVLVPESGTIRIDVELRRAVGPQVRGRVVDASTGDPVVSAAVEIEGAGTTETDQDGRFVLEVPSEGPVAVRGWAYGYRPVDTVAVAALQPEVLTIRLPVRPLSMGALSVRALRTGGSEAERALYDREPRPGVVGLSQREIEAVPAMIEPDVMRSLQALPGVVQVNDMSARLQVRGGGPDQTLFLLDGARVFAPYHVFGIFGAFNTDAVSRIEFYRGDLPARYGGTLSAVVNMAQRNDAERWVEGDVSVGLQAVGGTVRGIVPGIQGRWMVAARRSMVADVLGTGACSPSGPMPRCVTRPTSGRTCPRVSASISGAHTWCRMPVW